MADDANNNNDDQNIQINQSTAGQQKPRSKDLLNSVMASLTKSRREKATKMLTELVQKQQTHEIALAQANAEINKFLRDFDDGLLP